MDLPAPHLLRFVLRQIGCTEPLDEGRFPVFEEAGYLTGHPAPRYRAAQCTHREGVVDLIGDRGSAPRQGSKRMAVVPARKGSPQLNVDEPTFSVWAGSRRFHLLDQRSPTRSNGPKRHDGDFYPVSRVDHRVTPRSHAQPLVGRRQALQVAGGRKEGPYLIDGGGYAHTVTDGTQWQRASAAQAAIRRSGLALLWKPSDWMYPAEALNSLLEG